MSYRTQNILSLVALAMVLLTCGYDILRNRAASADPDAQAQACCMRPVAE